MRLFIVHVMLLSVSTPALAQRSDTHLPKYYVGLGTGPSMHNGAFYAIDGTVVYKNHWITSVSFQHFEMTPKNLPSDYEQGYTLALIIPLPDEMPTSNIKSINFTAGKYFPLGRKTWITTEAGLAVT